MFRYRRYRVFLVFAIFAIAALYRFTTVRDWEDATASGIDSLQSLTGKKSKDQSTTDATPDANPAILKFESLVSETTRKPSKPSTSTVRSSTTSDGKEVLPPTSTVTTSSLVVEDKSTETLSTPIASSTSSTGPATPSIDNAIETVGGKGAEFGLGGKGRHEVPPPLTNKPAIHWSRMPEHFPVPSESLIALPTSKSQKIPKIQGSFRDESPTARIQREEKQKAVKAAFERSWSGYREKAWLHDELRPKSGGFRDPFCTWAATLVDALDTLWIMGMEEEFAFATQAVAEIDFTTTPRHEIPLFETTIRYLGGLLSAYDLSGGKYKILLEKAKELGEVLMGSFDTPNRMPITYYFWKPTFSQNPHRASTRTVLAELGSLSMEFTRLAQLTGEDKYYDAVARITNELQIWQSETKVPGLWPKYVDTSGCKKPDGSASLPQHITTAKHEQAPIAAADEEVASSQDTTKQAAVKSEENEQDSLRKSSIKDWPDRAGPGTAKIADPISSPSDTEDARMQGVAKASSQEKDKATSQNTEKPSLTKRQLESDAGNEKSAPDGTNHESVPEPVPSKPAAERVDCQPQGLSSPPNARLERFSFGGAADSTYEYLPKMHLLLGGNAPEYKKMYESAIDAANKHLLFRPMIPQNDREILVVGSADVRDDWQEEPSGWSLLPEQSHLLCFTGGMWGIGSKIFDRKEDLEIAKKLTDGCVWSYQATKTGIMPESMNMISCDSMKDCKWNQTLWEQNLDPYREAREESYKAMKQAQLQREAQMKLQNEQDTTPANLDSPTPQEQASNSEELPTEGPIAKRELEEEDEQKSTIPAPKQPTEAKSPEAEPEAAKAKDVEKKDTAVKDAESTPAKSIEGTSSPDTTAKAPAALRDDEEPAHIPTETPNPYPTHEGYIANRIRLEGLPTGVPMITSKSYILRPEAIESVFIMYRMTGDESWREKGWEMWQAIERETRTTHGHSAIKDVTRANWENNQQDEMESFWLAETLKYFYLLFSEESLVSLDEWVLNTEAHPFRRPK